MELVRQIRNFSLLIRQNTNGKKKQNKDRSNRDFSLAQAQKLPLVWSEKRISNLLLLLVAGCPAKFFVLVFADFFPAFFDHTRHFVDVPSV